MTCSSMACCAVLQMGWRRQKWGSCSSASHSLMRLLWLSGADGTDHPTLRLLTGSAHPVPSQSQPQHWRKKPESIECRKLPAVSTQLKTQPSLCLAQLPLDTQGWLHVLVHRPAAWRIHAGSLHDGSWVPLCGATAVLGNSDLPRASPDTTALVLAESLTD